MADWTEECACGRGEFDPEEYNTCYTCYLERRESYINCIWCDRWHSPNYNTCYKCRVESPGRDEAGRNLRLDILIRDEFTCRDCGQIENPQIDHIMPCAEGGTAAVWNLQVLCQQCNHNKGRQWWPGSCWDYTRITLMHLYFTFGWSMLDEDQRRKLFDDSRIYSDEFTWHIHWQEFSEKGADTSVPSWILALADEEIPV